MSDPEELLNWFGAIQAQDFPSSKWAIGARLDNVTDQTVEQAIANGKLVRSWLMRGTLHLTTAGDIGWILDLLAPRIIKASAGRNRQLELDDATFSQSRQLLTKTLLDGQPATRKELAEVYEDAGISPKGQRLYHMLHRAALEKLICFGPTKNNQQTFVLLNEHVDPFPTKSREEALAELTKRYFQSHGPATLEDFTWWSGLKKTDARKGMESIEPLLQTAMIGDKTYYFSESAGRSISSAKTTFLLPAFDEYVIAYRNRSALLADKHSRQVISTNGIFYPVIVHCGEVIGTWRRTLKKDQVMFELKPFEKLNKIQTNGVRISMEDCSNFNEKEIVLL